mmetsp:Transcript_12044/g.14030  ORF Transcript_12044/g.14030 Transcript_12044/m.14030 type:complete len:488 (+) Transcript_12044:226-1689(+)
MAECIVVQDQHRQLEIGPRCEKKGWKRAPMIVCATTKDYRFQVQTLLTGNDVVLEIGCSYGKTTALIAHRTNNVVGVDIEPHLIEECKIRNPHIPFHCRDANKIEEWHTEVLEMSGLPSDHFSVVFIDVAGTIEISLLLPMIEKIERYIRPRCVVVKSLNYDKLLRQLSLGQKLKGGRKTEFEGIQPSHDLEDDICDGSDGNIMRLDNLSQATKTYLKEMKLKHIIHTVSPCPFPKSSKRGLACTQKNERVMHCNVQNMDVCKCIPAKLVLTTRNLERERGKGEEFFVMVITPFAAPLRQCTFSGSTLEELEALNIYCDPNEQQELIRLCTNPELKEHISRDVRDAHKRWMLSPPFLPEMKYLLFSDDFCMDENKHSRIPTLSADKIHENEISQKSQNEGTIGNPGLIFHVKVTLKIARRLFMLWFSNFDNQRSYFGAARKTPNVSKPTFEIGLGEFVSCSMTDIQQVFETVSLKPREYNEIKLSFF